MGKTVIIGCKLPHGLVIQGQKGPIKINGMNTSTIVGGYGLTHVDENEAAIFFATNKDFAPVKSNAIFMHGDDNKESLDAMARELKDEKTGFEGLDPSKPAPGLKPEDGQALKSEEVGAPKKSGRK